MLIDGTHFWMKVPSGFMYEQKIFGFKKDALHFIQTSESTNSNFNDEINITNKQTFEKTFPNYEVKEFVKFKLNGFKAVFIHYVKDKMINNYELHFGDNNSICTIFGSSSLLKTDIANEIRNCMLSVFYDKSITVENKDHSNFILKENSSQFKLFKEIPNIQIFTIGGKELKAGDPSIYLCHFLFEEMQNVEIISRNNYVALTQNRFIPKSNKLGKITFLNTVDDYLYTIEGTLDGEDVTCLQFYNTEGNRCVVSISFMMGDYSEIVKEMKILSNATEFLN
jgi:hypothetical protein